VAGNIVGQLVRIMPTSGFRYELFISGSKAVLLESELESKVHFCEIFFPLHTNFALHSEWFPNPLYREILWVKSIITVRSREDYINIDF